MLHQPAQNGTKATRDAVRQELAESAELEWWKTSDGVEHAVRIWSTTPQRAIVLYFHGIESHGRWFEDTALELNKRAVTTFAFDRRGAGSSKAERGHAASWKVLVDDADELLAEVRRRNPGTPIFLVANCWGSKIALSVAAREHNSDLRGVAMTSPAVCVQVDVNFVTKLKIGLSLLKGGKDMFEIPLTPEHFTDVPNYLDYIRRDPFRLTHATASFFYSSRKLDAQCKAAVRALRMPVLVLQPGKDTIVNVDKINRWFSDLSATDKTLTMFPDSTHSLDFDLRAADYQNALANWILERAQ